MYFIPSNSLYTPFIFLHKYDVFYITCYSWVGFNETNFTNLLSFDVFSPTETRVCRNWTLPLTMSLRYNGPLDLATPSVSIYNGTTSANLGGIERTFTGLSATNFGFVPKAIFITGRSSWTGFANEDFSGISTCFSTSELAGWGDLAGKEIRSFVQGCNSLFESENFDKFYQRY